MNQLIVKKINPLIFFNQNFGFGLVFNS